MNRYTSKTPVIFLIAACASRLISPVTVKAERFVLTLGGPLTGTSGPTLAWDPATYSFQAGYRYLGSSIGTAATAFGYGHAAGPSSFAAGAAYAGGEYSFAGGGASATEYFATAFGSSSYASGWASFAAGEETFAQESCAVALGSFTYAFGYGSFAAGNSTAAYETSATALGESTTAWGVASTAIGTQTVANAYGSLALGRFNVGAYTTHADPNLRGTRQWYAADPVFEIGIGSPPTAATNWQPIRSNALTVYKNGNITIPKRQGDIRMGDFGNPGD